MSFLEPVPHCPACSSDHVSGAFTSAAQMHASKPVFPFSRCKACGVLFLSSRPSLAMLKDFYPDTYLPYRQERAWGPFGPLVSWSQKQLDARRVKAVAQAASLTPQSRVLDVGCGKPTFLKALHERHGAECWGLDFKVSGWKHETGMESLHLVEGEIASAPLEGTFDVITLWHYLEHDPTPLETLKHLQRWSHPGTVLLIEVPNLDALSHRVFGSRWAGLHTPRHMALYNPQQLAALVERAGFDVQRRALPGTLGPYILWWLSLREILPTRWTGSMVRYLPGFLLGAVLLAPVLALHRWTKDSHLLVAQAH